MDPDTIYAEVGRRYTSAALQGDSATRNENIARSFGYTTEQLASSMNDSNLGLSCGNPLAMASLKEGETVIDLGSGAGFDVFLAATAVGPKGKVIGIDMNTDMLARATRIKQENRVANVEFVHSKIDDVSSLRPGIADCIISNCVINLVPEADKHRVFKEIFRLLKPGGRVAISDILAKKPLSQSLKSNIALYVDCISGASQVVDYERYLSDAGFEDTLIKDTNANLNVYLESPGCCKTDVSEKTCCNADEVECNNVPGSESCARYASNTSTEETPVETSATLADLNEWVGSFKIYAIKTDSASIST